MIKDAGPVGKQTRPRKSMGAGYMKLKKIGSLFLKTGFVLMCLVMMGTNSMLCFCVFFNSCCYHVN